MVRFSRIPNRDRSHARVDGKPPPLLLPAGVDAADETGEGAFLYIAGGGQIFGEFQACGRRFWSFSLGEFCGDRRDRVHQLCGGRGLKVDRH
ncbi:hypothetical protein GCM10009727_72610 [Actinomadura napierensis]|uniref:Uncharacterized protein n=1 Tax=Actinomadura napierensis TaxID=267854 RepID=A0ABN3ACA7_9ACTN